MKEPESISELIVYAEEHKTLFGFYPAAVFTNELLLADVHKHWMLTFSPTIDFDMRIITDTVYGIRLIERNGYERKKGA